MPVVNTSPFEITAESLPGGTVLVSLVGDFDMGVGDRLSEALVGAARRPGGTAVVVDLQRTTFFGSHGLAALVAGYAAATQAGRHFTVVNAHGLVEQVLQITGLAEVLLGHDHPGGAAQALS
jgi:anti-anti-sigma factor